MAQTDLIVRLIGNTSGLEKSLKQANSSVNRFQRGISSAVKSLGLAFGGAALLRGIQVSIRKIGDFEEQMAKVAAVSRAAPEDIERLKNNAIELGKASRFTAGEIGGMQEVLARLGFGTQKIVDSTDAIRKLAQASSEELAPSATAVAKTLNAFNLSATESGRVANVMAESFSMSALNLEEFSIGMSFAATSGRIFGLSLEEVTAMLAVLTDNGIQGSKAGVGLRDIFSDLAVKGVTLEEAYSKVNASTNKLATAFSLVGKVSQNQLVILAENAEKVDELSGAFGDANHEMDNMVRIMEDSLNNDLKLLESAFDGVILKGSKLNPVLRGITQLFTAMLGGQVSGGFLDVSALSATELTDRIEKLNFQLDETKKKFDRNILTVAEYNSETEKFNKVIEIAKKRLSELEKAPFPKQFEILPPLIKKTNTELVEQLSIINQIKSDLDKLKKAKEESFSTKEISKFNLQIAILEDKLRDINNLGAIKTPLPTTTPEKIDAQPLSISTTSDNALEDLKRLSQVRKRMEKEGDAFRVLGQSIIDDLTGWQAIKDTLVQGIAGALADGFSAVGAAIANGENAILAAGNSLLRSFGKLMSQLGAQMIASGIALIAANVAWTNPFTSGAGLIIAGAALAALGGAVSAFSSGARAGNGSGSGGGGGRSSSSGFDNVGLGFEQNKQSVSVNVYGVIEGDKIRFLLDKSDRNRGIGG